MKEQAIQKKIIKDLTKDGCYVIKVITGNRAGIPDIIACRRGVFFGIEVKTETGTLSKLQIVHLSQIAEAGGVSISCFGYSDFTVQYAELCRRLDQSQ